MSTTLTEISAPANTQFAKWHQETVADILARAAAEGKPEPTFFEDYSDDATRKDYGSLPYKASDLPQDRIVGVYGTRKVQFGAPTWLDRGAKGLLLKPKKGQPIICKGVLGVNMH